MVTHGSVLVRERELGESGREKEKGGGERGEAEGRGRREVEREKRGR